MSNISPIDIGQEIKANIQYDQIGARTISIFMERPMKIFAVAEPELNSISYLNTVSTAFISVGAFFLSIFIGNVDKPKYPEYAWSADPVGWASLLFFIAGSAALWLKISEIKKIKNQSSEIKK